jgi:hypothetical protein
MKEKLEQSHRSISSNKSKYHSANLNESSILNSSAISGNCSNTIKKKYNMKERINFENMTKFQEFLNVYNPNKNVLLFLDSKNSFWELVKRNDLSINYLISNVDNIISVTSGLDAKQYNSNNIYGEESPKSKFYNLEIKDRSCNNSDLDISRMTDLNISHFIRDINDA